MFVVFDIIRVASSVNRAVVEHPHGVGVAAAAAASRLRQQYLKHHYRQDHCLPVQRESGGCVGFSRPPPSSSTPKDGGGTGAGAGGGWPRFKANKCPRLRLEKLACVVGGGLGRAGYTSTGSRRGPELPCRQARHGAISLCRGGRRSRGPGRQQAQATWRRQGTQRRLSEKMFTPDT